MAAKSISVNVPLYGLEAIYKACYAFLERAYIRLEGDPTGLITVLMSGKTELSPAELDRMADEFHNELLHHALRVKVSTSNQKVREYIVTRALSSAEGAQAPVESQEPPLMDAALEKEIEKLLAEVEKGAGADPLKIVVPYEEKNEKAASQTPPAKDR